MNLSFKDFNILLEKVSKAQHNEVLNDPNFLVGFEFEFYLNNVKPNTEVYDDWLEFNSEIESSIEELEEAYLNATREGDEIIDETINDFNDELKKLEVDKDEYDDEDYNELISDIEEKIERLEDAKGEYYRFEHVADIVDNSNFEYDNEWEHNISFPTPSDVFIEYISMFVINAHEWISEHLFYTIIEYKDPNRFEYYMSSRGIPIPEEDGEYTDSFEEVIEEYFPFNDFPYKNIAVTEIYDFKIWRLMEDGSLKGGIELTSPIMVLKDAVNVLPTVLNFIKEHGHTETERGEPGLHINISYKGANMKNLDPLKIILFTDEGYISRHFNDRRYADYVSFMYEKIVQNSKKLPNINTTKTIKELVTLVSPIMTPKRVKSSGINLQSAYGKTGRVEFRYLGGYDYEYKGDAILKNMLKFAFYLKIGLDKDFKNKEYVKKITKLYNKFSDMKPHISPTRELMINKSLIDNNGNIYINVGDEVLVYKKGDYDKNGKPLPNIKVNTIPKIRFDKMVKMNPDIFKKYTE